MLKEILHLFLALAMVIILYAVILAVGCRVVHDWLTQPDQQSERRISPAEIVNHV